MQVFLVFYDFGPYEGYTAPEKAFDSMEKAEAWVKENLQPGRSFSFDIIDMEVE